MKLYSVLVLFPVIYLHLLTGFSFADSRIDSTSINFEYSKENTLGFVKFLISRNEYYRAFVELKRLESFYPGYLSKEKNYTTEFYLLFKGHQYQDIIVKKLNNPGPNIAAIHSIFKIDSLFENSDFLKAKTVVDATGFTAYNKQMNIYLYKRTILSYLLLNMIDKAKMISDNNILDYSELQNFDFGELAKQHENFYGSYKNPNRALALGVIPGMGYVYSGQKATGIIAFIIISAFSTLTYYSFKTDNKPLGVFIGTAATFFYGGSIIGGYLSAQRYNESAAKDLKAHLSEVLQIEKDREELFNEYGVGRAGDK